MQVGLPDQSLLNYMETFGGRTFHASFCSKFAGELCGQLLDPYPIDPSILVVNSLQKVSGFYISFIPHSRSQYRLVSISERSPQYF